MDSKEFTNAYKGFEFFVYLHIDCDNGKVVVFFDNALREMEGFGADIIKTRLANAKNDIDSTIIRNGHAYNIWSTVLSPLLR